MDKGAGFSCGAHFASPGPEATTSQRFRRQNPESERGAAAHSPRPSVEQHSARPPRQQANQGSTSQALDGWRPTIALSDPDRFDVSREPNKHMTFAFGAHLCIGAGLARRELEVALLALLRRMPHLRLDPERPVRPRCTSLVLRGFESMPVRWD